MRRYGHSKFSKMAAVQRSNQQEVGHFGPKFPVTPLGVDPWCLNLQRANAPR